MDLAIRRACCDDISPLSRVMGDGVFFAERFARQENGRGVLFIAWLGDEPVGVVYLWLEDAEEFRIRQYLPKIALLTHLEVLPEFRSQGIGRKIVGAVEGHLVDHGHQRVALAVRDDNDRAIRLYRTLGYQNWGHGKLVCFADLPGPDGRRIAEPELCYVLVKWLHSIRPSSDSTLAVSGVAN